MRGERLSTYYDQSYTTGSLTHIRAEPIRICTWLRKEIRGEAILILFEYTTP